MPTRNPNPIARHARTTPVGALAVLLLVPLAVAGCRTASAGRTVHEAVAASAAEGRKGDLSAEELAAAESTATAAELGQEAKDRQLGAIAILRLQRGQEVDIPALQAAMHRLPQGCELAQEPTATLLALRAQQAYEQSSSGDPYLVLMAAIVACVPVYLSDAQLTALLAQGPGNGQANPLGYEAVLALLRQLSTAQTGAFAEWAIRVLHLEAARQRAEATVVRQDVVDALQALELRGRLAPRGRQFLERTFYTMPQYRPPAGEDLSDEHLLKLKAYRERFASARTFFAFLAVEGSGGPSFAQVQKDYEAAYESHREACARRRSDCGEYFTAVRP